MEGPQHKVVVEIAVQNCLESVNLPKLLSPPASCSEAGGPGKYSQAIKQSNRNAHAICVRALLSVPYMCALTKTSLFTQANR